MSLGLKLYYLRTRVKKITQTVMAKDLGIRQATISNIEQGLSQPSLPLLRQLCEYFDVTPTYLLDDDGGLEAGEADKWSNRHGLATSGQYLEVPESALHELESKSPNGKNYLIALLPGTPVYDEEAAKTRARHGSGDLIEAYRVELAKRRRTAKALRAQLDAERHASRLRRRGAKGASKEEQP